jgi:hypothetical protein
MRARRSGMALLLALVVLVLIEAITAGVVALGRHEQMVAASEARGSRAQAAAESAARLVMAAWPTEIADTLPVGRLLSMPAGTFAVADLTAGASVERLVSGAYLILAEARAGAANAFTLSRVAAVVRTLDRAGAIAESNAAITSGGQLIVGSAATVTGLLGALPDDWTNPVCPVTDPLPTPAAMASAQQPVVSESANLAGTVLVDSTLQALDSVALGGVAWGALSVIADRHESGDVHPAPALQDGACNVAASLNWGDAVPANPCGSYFPLIYSNGDIVMNGGVGQGVLAATGSVTITNGARFVGLIVARGSISVDGGARVEGAIRARSGYASISDATVSYSRCAVARSLQQTAAAHRLIPQQRTFIPAF